MYIFIFHFLIIFKLTFTTSKNGTYKKTPLAYCILSNGTSAYYVKDGRYLNRYTFSSKKDTRVKKIYSGTFREGDPWFYPSGYYKGKIYITKASFDDWKYSTYVYNISKKTYKLTQSNCDLKIKIKDRVIGQTEYRSDVSPYGIALYRFTSTGLKKVEKLSSWGWLLEPVGNDFYYATYPHVSSSGYHDMTQVNIYKIAYNSTKAKKLGSIKSENKSGYASIYPIKVTSTYVRYNEQDGTVSRECKYYFKSGKRVIIKTY